MAYSLVVDIFSLDPLRLNLSAESFTRNFTTQEDGDFTVNILRWLIFDECFSFDEFRVIFIFVLQTEAFSFIRPFNAKSFIGKSI